MKNKIKILFYPEGERFLYEFAPLINYLALIPSVDVHLLHSGENFKKLKNPNTLSADELTENVCVHIAPNGSKVGVRWIKKYEAKMYELFSRKTADLILNSIPSVLVLATLDLIDLVAAKKNANNLLKKVKPDAIIVPRDRSVGLSYALLKLAKKSDVLTCIAPWGFVNTSFIVANRANDRRNQLNGLHVSVIQLVMRLKNSKHLFCSNGITYSYFKPGRMLACILSGLCPTNPWFFGSDVDLTLVDSIHSLKALAAGGVPVEKIKVTGNQIHDALWISESDHALLLKSVSKKYNCVHNKKLIISLPHLAEHGLLDWGVHINEIYYILNTCISIGKFDILISLHPRCDKKKYQIALESFPVKILEEPLKSVLPIADYFACHWSSTTVWSASLGIPTLVFDWFGVSSMGFENLESKIFRVERREMLEDLLMRMFNSRRNTVKMKGLPIIDGRSSMRVSKAIIDAIVSSRNAKGLN